MKIKLESTFGELNFKGTNDRGQSLQFSGSKQAVSPMESVLMAAAACSAIDVESLLGKMRQKLERVEVEVEGIRVDDVPAVFETIHLHYIVFGEVKEDKAKKAVDMSVEKYCSVSTMLQQCVKITHSWEVRS